MAQNPHHGFVIRPQHPQQYPPPHDPRQYPYYQHPPQPQPAYPQYPQQHQVQHYPQQQQQLPPQHPYAPQYSQQSPPPRPRSSLGHAYSHSVPVASGYVNPPPLSPSAWQAQAAQAARAAQAAQAQVQPQPPSHGTGRPLPAPRRAETLPPAPVSLPNYPPNPAYPQQQQQQQQQQSQHQQYAPLHPVPVPPTRSNSNASSRPLPTPTPSTGIPRSPAKHQSLDLGRFSVPPRQRSPSPEKQTVQPTSEVPPPKQETPSQIRRRASPPRFTGGSGSWTEVAPRPPPASSAPIVAATKSSEFKDLLSGLPPTAEGGKFVPMWKRGLITNGNKTPAPAGRPLPSPSTASSAPSNGLKRGGSLHVRSPASAAVEKTHSPSPEPSDSSESESESEVGNEENGPEESEDSESESEVSASETDRQPPPSPGFGIRDLPRPPSMDARASTLPQPPAIRPSAFEGRSAPGIMEGGAGTTGSRTLMFAAAGLNSGNPKPNAWPAGVPPLPRTPAVKRDIGDLEDSPPVSSMRRGGSTSSTSASAFAATRSSPLKSPSVAPSAPAQVPSFSFSGPASPLSPASPKVQVPSFTISGPAGAPPIPTISFPDDDPPSTKASVPKINLPGDDGDDSAGPSITVQDVDSKPKLPPQIFEVPGISFSGGQPSQQRSLPARPPNASQLRGIACGGCNGSIIGRIVNAMGLRWHPECFKCSVCSELLEHVSSYEHDGKAYCHLDYHENFAPRCYSCKTTIVDERFISLDDPELGKRTYHEQHFFCAECGDPFLPPSLPDGGKGELAFSGDGAFMSDDVGFTVYRGHPYCEACHVRLRLPKCKKCKRSIRDHDEAVEALGGKWCWACFCCAGCDKPFENPTFFERDGKPWCEPCFSILLRNEL